MTIAATAIVGVAGVVIGGLGAYGLMGEVSESCGSLDPYSEEGISCFNNHYSSNWGLHHVLSHDH